MNSKILPPFPYGAVYFRKSNPPKEDWERDYKTASEDGMNIFRHCCLRWPHQGCEASEAISETQLRIDEHKANDIGSFGRQ